MTFYVTLDIRYMDEWGLSLNAGVVLARLVELAKWADTMPFELFKKHKDIDRNEYEKNPFYICYIQKISADVPILPTSKSQISRYLKELEEKGMIEYINKHNIPAIRLSDRGKMWGQWTYPKKNKAVFEEKDKKSFLLQRSCSYENLSKDYQDRLKATCMQLSKDKLIPSDEYEKFISHHCSKGSKYVNWFMAYNTWSRNYAKWNANDGEKDGIYTG